ncbi:MAG: hypothetical protein SPL13_05175 [Clostridia bacterium]|nr:hypothetical protein [Clostridia bacterium]
MKKKLLSIVALVIALMMTLAMFTGCDLVTTDNEKDMAQIVATVKISDSDNARKDEIKKSQMVTYYLNYGYYYVSQQGMTNEQAFNFILENLINGKIMLQTALIYFGAENTGDWEAVNYLSDDEKTEAVYNTRKSMDSLIDNYEDDEDEKKYETFSDEVRTVPTDAANAEDDPSTVEMQEYNAETETYGATVGDVGTARYKAYNKVLKYLRQSKLLGDGVETLKDSIYYKDTLKSNQESILVEKYENELKQAAREELTFDTLKAQYEEMFASQEKTINSATEFETALSNATAKNPVVYTPYTGYVYVYNLLLGANDYQTALINELDSKDANYYTDLKNILSGTAIKDLRSSWIYSGYDFDGTTQKFTGDYAFLEDSIPYQGTVELVNVDKDEDEDAVYKITDAVEYTVDEFIDFMDNYVYGSSKTAKSGSYYDEFIYKVVDSSSAKEDYDARINELLFAFSTDPGSLNTYKGYLITPEPEIGGSDTFVKEFAKAGRLFIEENLGDKSYVITATNYGYHVMFFSQMFGADSNYATLVEYLNYVTGTDAATGTESYWENMFNDMIADWENADEKSYLYTIADLLSDAANVLQENEAKTLSKYRSNDNYVVRYQSRYQDLLDM